MVVSGYLDILGYKYDVASTGEEALHKAKTKKYSVILMDIQMPDKNGIEVTTALRSHEEKLNLETTPIIAITAHAIKTIRDKCFEAGMNDYISKPYNTIILKDKIDLHVASK